MPSAATAFASFRREKPPLMSKENIIVARRQTDGTLVQVLPDGSTRPLKDETDWKTPQGDGRRGSPRNGISRPRRATAHRRRFRANEARPACEDFATRSPPEPGRIRDSLSHSPRHPAGLGGRTL